MSCNSSNIEFYYCLHVIRVMLMEKKNSFLDDSSLFVRFFNSREGNSFMYGWATENPMPERDV